MAAIPRIVRAALGGSLLFLISCGGATVTAPADEGLPIPADMGPLLSQVVTQASVSGVTQVAGAQMGRSIAVGDFNGDGRLDTATGAPWREAGMVIVRQSTGATGFLLYYARLSSQDVTGRDKYGWSLAAGDFNGDGMDDLAVGAPGRDVGGVADAGEVFVMYGTRVLGLSYAGMTRIAQGQDGAIEPGDEVGSSLAAGDFNADGYADLAVGAPGEDYQGEDAGAVLIRWGSGTGLGRAFTPTLLTHADPQAHSKFGYSLVSGRFESAWIIGGHGKDDLAVGSPYRKVTEWSTTAQAYIEWEDAGEVTFYSGVRGQTYGLATGRSLMDRKADRPRFGLALAAGRFNGSGLDQLAVGAPHHLDGRGYVAIVDAARRRVAYRVYQAPAGVDETADEFGYALASGDFDNDGFEDLAIGAPYEDGPRDSGIVHIRFGTADTLVSSVSSPPTPSAHLSYFLSQTSTIAARESGDRFGFALAAGDLNADGAADLMIGSPYEDLSGASGDLVDAGALFIALSRAPVMGAFEGTWTGTLSGDAGSSAPVTLTLLHRNGTVGGTAQIAEPGIIVNVAEVCASGSDDDEEPIGERTLRLTSMSVAAGTTSVTFSGTLTVSGYSIPYTLRVTLSADGSTLTARFCVTDPSPGGVCGGNRCFTTRLT
jgi:hypothetical protein